MHMVEIAKSGTAVGQAYLQNGGELSNGIGHDWGSVCDLQTY